LAQIPHGLQQDDEAVRDLYRAEIDLSTHRSFHALDMIAQELKILTLLPQSGSPGPETLTPDHRERNGLRQGGYSERLEPSISELLKQGKAGPILSQEGKPLKPFTLLNSRQTVRDGVFRPDHSLPTMTIEEYLAEEKRRGGMIEAGGGQSGKQPADQDEDTLDKADIQTMKAREWDEFTEANPKGSGNTMNRG